MCNTTQRHKHKQQWREERDAHFLAGNTIIILGLCQLKMRILRFSASTSAGGPPPPKQQKLDFGKLALIFLCNNYLYLISNPRGIISCFRFTQNVDIF